jgi:hypothetical protein
MIPKLIQKIDNVVANKKVLILNQIDKFTDFYNILDGQNIMR